MAAQRDGYEAALQFLGKQGPTSHIRKVTLKKPIPTVTSQTVLCDKCLLFTEFDC